jgi:hypothetical protein
MYFVLKSFPNISLRDLDPQGIVRNEDLVGIKQLELWYALKYEKERKRNEVVSRTKANQKNR